ncbi:DUF2971 domain-containing protein [Photobacterium carnosum]|jgi:hypothetical protein|nr:DUF2971 domain-containing protein [Photobacterium carnosum]MCD9514274.1 DUF2971 domain-containing protein [Photobacterium carnosum]MCD9533198.1 DUF2971 domain-containing protein [Photobacterium carnosum]
MMLDIGSGLKVDTTLCRYFSFESFVHLVETKMLTFTKVSNWDDPWETELSNYDHDKKGNKAIYSRSQHFFGQCWTTKSESDAMWRIYSPSKSGVKITTNIGQFNLLQNIRRLGVEKVVYFSHWKQLPELTNIDKSPYLDVRYKRDAFSHEEEVRFIVHPDSILDGDFWDNSHINLPICVHSFIQSIEIDPRAPVWVVDMIERYVKRVLPEVSIGKSNLYQKNTEFKLVKEWVPVGN